MRVTLDGPGSCCVSARSGQAARGLSNRRARPGGRRSAATSALTGPKAPMARRAPSDAAAGPAVVQSADHLQDRREDAAVDADGGAGQAQQLGPVAVDHPLHMAGLEAAQRGQRHREQRQACPPAGRAPGSPGASWPAACSLSISRCSMASRSPSRAMTTGAVAGRARPRGPPAPTGPARPRSAWDPAGSARPSDWRSAWPTQT